MGTAVVRAAEILGLPRTELAVVLGVDEAEIPLIGRGEIGLVGKPFEFAVILLRIYRSLAVIVGQDDRVIKSWMLSPNTVLLGKPAELIRTVTGLLRVDGYLDGQIHRV